MEGMKNLEGKLKIESGSMNHGWTPILKCGKWRTVT
jgi:hypothetical protein